MGIKLISVTGNTSSTLARAGDVVLDIGVREEACPLGLAPTASTTSALAMGDALAVALLEKRGFTKEDFAFVHPGGAIGKKLILLVQELMHVADRIPLVKEDTLMKEAIFEITSKGLGVTGVVDGSGKLVGIITDGDLRRALEADDNLMTKKVKDVMSAQPKIIEINDLAAKALQIMESFSITSLFVHNGVDKMKPVGIVHIHDLLKAGVA
jgi:arabinose-5-phosphate isomerase